MSAVLDDTTTVEEQAVSTAAAPPAGRLGRVMGWVVVALLVVGVVLISSRFVTTAPNLAGGLNPDSAGPYGSRALAEIARNQGVQIDVERNRVSAANALRPGSTLVLTDPYPLSDEAALELIGSADNVVLLSSSSRMLNLLDLGRTSFTGGEVTAQCDLPEFSRVGMIDATRTFMPAEGVTGCFVDDEGAAAMLRGEHDGTTVTVVEGTRLLSNENLAENGNAALGLALIAQTEHVVWYVPSFSDTDLKGQQTETIGDLTPEWVTPAIALLLLAAIAVMIARGRRFGPLVAELLPVTVRASETMQGRARLTAQAADAGHAASAIRNGTRTHLAARLALSPRATAQEVADAASDRLRVPRGSLYELLDGSAPQSDRDLIVLARELAELETAVEQTVHTERNRP